MDTNAVIKNEIRNHGKTTSGRIAKLARISRQAAHRQLSLMVKQNKLIKAGSTKGSFYLPYSKAKAKQLHNAKKKHCLRLINKGLEEDLVFDGLESKYKEIFPISANARGIFRYAFTEMLNNAIEHSRSKKIDVIVWVWQNEIMFEIIDHGVGIYNNLRHKFGLKGDLEAIQELLKGKRSTAPKKHSGEGIFFTSKIADQFIIESSKLKLLIDNKIKDVLVEDIPVRKGTKIYFQISKKTKKELKALFNEYTNEKYEFRKTKVVVKLYSQGVDYVSRSQGRRVIFGLEKFQHIILDFKGIKGIGQGFADEIFRVFKSEHASIIVEPINANQAVLFMINRAIAARNQQQLR